VIVKADNTRSKKEVTLIDFSAKEWNKVEDIMRSE